MFERNAYVPLLYIKLSILKKNTMTFIKTLLIYYRILKSKIKLILSYDLHMVFKFIKYFSIETFIFSQKMIFIMQYNFRHLQKGNTTQTL